MRLITNRNDYKPSKLELLGVSYLNKFRITSSNHNAFQFSDIELKQKINRIKMVGILLSALVSIVCIFPTVWVDIYYTNESFLKHYGYLGVVTLASIIIEFYLLFLIAMQVVHRVGEIINIHATQSELLNNQIFGVKNILARTALEISDPDLLILGIDPFKRINKRNLLIIGLFYKAKITLTNFVLKWILKNSTGDTVFGISILYEAIIVEIFWNCLVIIRVVKEARFRLFGFALANEIAVKLIQQHIVESLSAEAKEGCMRAIGNTIVMTKNYHPNMIILFLRFQDLLKITEAKNYDSLDLFLETLGKVSLKERLYLLKLFTIAASFDGAISKLENQNLEKIYGNDYATFYPMLRQLTAHLNKGELNAALELCHLE